MRLLLRRATSAMGQQPVWMVIALVLDAVIAVTGILIGGSFNLTGLLAVGPLLACARCNGRMTALVAGWALALYAVVAVVTGTTRTTLEGYRFGTVAVAGALAVFAATVRSRREGALITISERVQHAILRPLPAELGGMAFASHYQSATTQALVGGDLYDITMTQFGPRFIIGDVKGKGLDAVGRCAAVLAVFREVAFGEADLVDLAASMDARLAREMEIEDFVTVILAEFAPGEVRLSSRFILDNLFLLAAAFLVVASMTWSAGLAGWTAFGVSAAISVIAGASAVLTAHEATTEKVVHQLVVHDGTTAEQRAAA